MSEVDLNKVGIAALAHRIAIGEITSEAAVRACLQRIEAREPTVHAWAYLDPALALDQARNCDRAGVRGTLHGVPIGIKDIFDTVDQPTAFGSPVYAGHRPHRDAGCVALLRAAGAVILGKTATTEFAGAHPAPTTNPWNPKHTPGGSSSGSAAAVADCMVPGALGTQTMGSVIRPASFCGVVGFKPSHGLIPVDGIKPSALICDTVGVLVRAVEDACCLMSVLARSARGAWSLAMDRPPRIAVMRGPDWSKASSAAETALEQATQIVARAGAATFAVAPPRELDAMLDAAWVLLRYENSQHWAFEHRSMRDRLSPSLGKFLDEAVATTVEDYAAAVEIADEGRRAVADVFKSVDVIMTVSASGEAPLGLQSTGDTVFNRAWTLAQVPCLTLPGAQGPSGLPIGIQLIGPRFADAHLLAIGRWMEPLLRGEN
jgi:Asp-tRNA(Asn)/Glu-tRNA(Gln) amidotransferase A subunit family amidase